MIMFFICCITYLASAAVLANCTVTTSSKRCLSTNNRSCLASQGLAVLPSSQELRRNADSTMRQHGRVGTNRVYLAVQNLVFEPTS
jgi:hypothetical protein